MDEETGTLNFEDFAHANGDTFWYAREFAAMLGYQSWATFRKGPLEKAYVACLTLQLPLGENFRECSTEDGQPDFKLTRFACYLVSMNGDSRKPPVAQAQAYFAGLAIVFREYLEGREEVERVLTRGEITERGVALASTAKSHGVVDYALFQNAGYLGMYNMHLGVLRTRKGVPGNRSPLDFMGSTELAANLFRITQTDEKIRNEAIRGQAALEQTHRFVGKAVRKTMLDIGGTAPEHLPPAPDIKQVHKELKATSREFRKMDKGKLPPPS